MLRTDETWHRLLTWTAGQTPSERLAAQILYASDFKDVDPVHPLGGRDGGKDARCLKDGKVWVMAVYFPHGAKTFKDIENKFKGDLAGARKNSAHGVAFVTNQTLTEGERVLLVKHGQKGSSKTEVELFHLERIVAILDTPSMVGVRAQYLNIPVVHGIGKSDDRTLFEEFLKVLPNDSPALHFLRHTDLGASFRSTNIDVLVSIAQTWDDATHEFINDVVEAERKKFMDALTKFLSTLFQFSHPHPHMQGWMTIGMDDLEMRPEMFALRDNLNNLATKVYDTHQELIRAARKNL